VEYEVSLGSDRHTTHLTSKAYLNEGFDLVDPEHPNKRRVHVKVQPNNTWVEAEGLP
jgi:hypothetical protein